MRFNMGPSRFRQFRKLIAAVKEKVFSRAAEEMEDSNRYRQVGKRHEITAFRRFQIFLKTEHGATVKKHYEIVMFLKGFRKVRL